jgi:hypothetical protein
MNTAAMAYAMAVAFAPPGGSFPPIPARAGGRVSVAQYCVPPADRADAHRVYCRDEGGSIWLPFVVGQPLQISIDLIVDER